MQVNTEVKGNLAKLLATENLTVEHRKITTAYFDVERRILALPIWREVTGDVYDLLVGHEVGHALYTPNEDWGDAPKDFVNVLEDARVERKMKVTYPGLRKSFFKGYQELNERDFFGIRHRELDNLSLIDRINLHFKIGTVNSYPIPFSEEELVWVDRAEKTVTFEDVVQLAKELYGNALDKEQEKIDNISDQGTTSGGSDEDTEFNPSSSSVTEESDDAGDANANDNANEEDNANAGGEIGNGNVDETESVTAQAWNDSQHLLVDDDAKEWVYVKTPQVLLNNIIIPWKEIHDNLKTYFDENDYRYPNSQYSAVEFTYNKYREYKKSAISSVNYLVKQFEMKKSAAAYHRQMSSKTGVINTNRLHAYKYTEDIFKRVTVLPDGKSHGLVMYLDWSGSMGECIMDTLKQLYNLIWFCKKVAIPFRVYAFQAGCSAYCDSRVQKLEEYTIKMDESFRLLEFFSSRMNSRTLDAQMQYVWAQAYSVSYGSHYHGGYTYYGLGSTPYVEVAVSTPEIVKKFLAEEKIQKVNVISLTDGESNPLEVITEKRLCDEDMGLRNYRTGMMCHNLNKVWILRDRNGSYSRRMNPSPYVTTSEIVSFFRGCTNYNWIGIRLCSKSDLNQMLNRVFDAMDYTTRDKFTKEWTDKKFVKVSDKLGFTQMFVMPNRYIGGGTEELDVKAKGSEPTRAELQRAFKKHMGSKMTNKTLLNAFVEQIV